MAAYGEDYGLKTEERDVTVRCDFCGQEHKLVVSVIVDHLRNISVTIENKGGDSQAWINRLHGDIQ